MPRVDFVREGEDVFVIRGTMIVGSVIGRTVGGTGVEVFDVA